MNALRATVAALAMSAGFAWAQTPPTPNPAPTPKFNTGSLLDGIRNQAWAKVEEMKDAYARCDPDRYERALRDLEQLRQQARAAASAARGAGQFSNVKPDEAEGLVDAMDGIIEPRRYALADLKRRCGKERSPGATGTAVGPTQTPVQPGTTGVTGAPTTPSQAPQPQCPPQPQPQPGAATPPERTTSILDEIEEMERWEKEQKAKQRQQQAQTPAPQGLSQADMQAIGAQQATIESFEADIAKLKDLLKQGRLDEAHNLVDDLDDWLDWLEGRGDRFGPRANTSGLPKELIDKWDAAIDKILDEFVPMPKLRLDLQSSTILQMHNKARLEVGLAPMAWDTQLACQAISYGPTLARYDHPVHSPRTGRETSRENLLQALPGTPADRMINVWTMEKRYFKPGIFPDVSTSGNWADVGHYTQIAWPTTTSVGCGVQRGTGKFDWLICRYAPPGNRDGTALWLPPPPPP